MLISVSISSTKPARSTKSGWDKMNSAERKRYAKHFPNSTFVVDAIKRAADKRNKRGADGHKEHKASKVKNPLNRETHHATLDTSLDLDDKGKPNLDDPRTEGIIRDLKNAGVRVDVVPKQGGKPEIKLHGSKEDLKKALEKDFGYDASKMKKFGPKSNKPAKS